MSTFIMGKDNKDSLILYKTRSVGCSFSNYLTRTIIENKIEYIVRNCPNLVVWTLKSGVYASRIHRENGPAVEYLDGTKQWYYLGGECSQEKHQKLIKLKAFW